MIHATPTIAVREIPLHAARTLAGATPRFNMVAFHWLIGDLYRRISGPIADGASA